MRIGVNTRFLLKDKLEGLGNYTHEVVSRMVKNHPEHDFVFFFDRPYSLEFIYSHNVKPVVVNPPARHPVLWKMWFDLMLPRALKKHKIDYFFSPDSFLSRRTKVPQHVVIHDLAFEHVKAGVSNNVQRFYKNNIPDYCELAKRITTVSNFTKKDIEKQYGIPGSKLDVALNGVSSRFKPITDNVKINVLDKYTSGKEYFVFVGAMHPRKNIANLLKAFDIFKEVTGSEFKLCLVGRKGWQNEEMERTFLTMKYSHEVVFAGRLNDVELASVLASAYAMVYVPFFEGFGLPILESHACEVPVVCSDTSSMPEVGGEAVVLVDPHNVSSISAGMERLLDAGFYDVLKSKISANLSRFSWDNTADDVWRSIIKGVSDAGI